MPQGFGAHPVSCPKFLLLPEGWPRIPSCARGHQPRFPWASRNYSTAQHCSCFSCSPQCIPGSTPAPHFLGEFLHSKPHFSSIKKPQILNFILFFHTMNGITSSRWIWDAPCPCAPALDLQNKSRESELGRKCFPNPTVGKNPQNHSQKNCSKIPSKNPQYFPRSLFPGCPHLIQEGNVGGKGISQRFCAGFGVGMLNIPG